MYSINRALWWMLVRINGVLLYRSIYLRTLKYLEKYEWHEKMLQTKSVWYREKHTIFLYIWFCDDLETSCEDHIQIFKRELTSFITYFYNWLWDVFKIGLMYVLRTCVIRTIHYRDIKFRNWQIGTTTYNWLLETDWLNFILENQKLLSCFLQSCSSWRIEFENISTSFFYLFHI